MQEKLRVGIAGYGLVGKIRRQFVDQHPQLETVGICDRLFPGEGIFEDGVRYYTYYKKLLEEDLDLLFVCLTNDILPEVTIAGLERGLHVFCEKPPGQNINDIVRVIQCERQHPNLKLKYGFNHRYHDSVRQTLQILKDEELGKILNIRGVYGKSKLITFASTWRAQRALAGGGILLDQGIHMVDMMRLFAGEFVQVYSFISNNFWNHDVEDNAYALMRTAGGVVALLHSSATQWRHRFHVEIALTHGGIILSGILSSSRSYGAETLTIIHAAEDDLGDPKEVTIRYNKDNSWRDEIDEFVKAILEDQPIINGSSSEALKTMHLVYRIYCADPEWRRQYNLDDKIPEGIL